MDSHRIRRNYETRFHTGNTTEGHAFSEVVIVLVGITLNVLTDLDTFESGSDNATRYRNEILEP